MEQSPAEFPAVQPGGSLLLAWQVRNRRVLVVGGGNVPLLSLPPPSPLPPPRSPLLTQPYTSRSPPAASCTFSTPTRSSQ